MLHSGCIVHSSNHWLTAVYENLINLEMEFQSLESTTIPLISVIEGIFNKTVKKFSNPQFKFRESAIFRQTLSTYFIHFPASRILCANIELNSVPSIEYKVTFHRVWHHFF